ncbi:MAG: altronate dehydratase [Clostridia bacterium]|nr:altronate dehydratase [Clostridia bacterium]
MSRLLRIHPHDNVAVDTGTGFKEALTDIPEGAPVIKYGYPIGHATAFIPRGATVHTDNMATSLSERAEYTFRGPAPVPPAEETGETFLGYVRSDGSVGTRNEIWILPTVGCVNAIAERLARECGCFAFPHPFGCSQLGDDHKTTQLVLRGLAMNPNAGGVLVLGLGCENNTMDSFRALLTGKDPDRIRYLVCQDAEDEIAEGKCLIAELKAQTAKDVRVPCPISALKVGLKCGGSDGYSGITANPLLGRFTDRLTGAGGTACLTEVPEMFGAEQLLMDRACSREVFEQIVSLINDYKDYFVRHGQVVYENPSPGNKAGGISTLEDKSLGCTQKSGSAPVMGVLRYGQFLKEGGLWLLEGPGNDMVAVTNLAAAGCTLILFTTGRGTPLGSPVPVLKVSSNASLSLRKSRWIDFDASPVLAGDPGIDGDFFRKVLQAASGEETANEKNGAREISIFKDGVML